MGLGSFIKKAAGAVSGLTGITGGDLFSAGAGILGGQLTNSAQQAAAGKANDFTVKMMQNRHQWEAADLQKAGLNRILGFGQSAPSMGSAQKADVTNPADNAIKGYEASTNRKLANANIQNVQAATQANLTQADLNRAAEGAKRMEALSSAANARRSTAEAILAEIERAPRTAQARNSAKEADTWTNKYIRPHTKAYADFIGDFTGAVGNIFRGSHSTVNYGK